MSVPRIDASGSGFWPTATAQVRECDPEQWQKRREDQGGTLRSTYLQDAVKYQVDQRSYPTPRVSMSHGPSEAEIAAGDPKHRLETAVAARGQSTRQTWGTPTQRDHKDTGSMENVADNVQTGSLNPDWVCWLQGWPVGWEDASRESQWECPSASTDCEHLVTVRCLSAWRLRSRSWLDRLEW